MDVVNVTLSLQKKKMAQEDLAIHSCLAYSLSDHSFGSLNRS